MKSTPRFANARLTSPIVDPNPLTIFAFPDTFNVFKFGANALEGASKASNGTSPTSNALSLASNVSSAFNAQTSRGSARNLFAFTHSARNRSPFLSIALANRHAHPSPTLAHIKSTQRKSSLEARAKSTNSPKSFVLPTRARALNSASDRTMSEENARRGTNARGMSDETSRSVARRASSTSELATRELRTRRPAPRSTRAMDAKSAWRSRAMSSATLARAFIRARALSRRSVVVHGKKKLRALVKKAGDAAEANANEFARAARGMNALDDDLREMRRREGEFASNERAMKEVLEALNAVASELRGVKDELAALRRERGRGDDVKSALLGGKKANIVVKSDEEMFAALTGGKSLEREVEAAAPVLDVTSWRGDGTDRSSEWPLVMKGEDDIYLMTIVHAKLNDAGFWAGEEDEDDMYFGASTMDALLYFQAAAGVPESGVVDPETWSALLGIEAFVWGPAPGAIAFDETKFSSQMEARGTPTLVAKSKSTPVAPKAPNLAEEDYDPDSYDPFGDDDERGAAQGPSFTLGTTKGKENKFKWPILREDDGGVMVHKLQIALSEKGFDSGEEDMEYWYFGLTTQAAVLTFQSSARLPETGTTDIATWRALLGDELMELDPKVALSRISDGLYPNDLTRTDRVFLLGEGRYEKR